MPINSASTPSLLIARKLRRKRRAGGGGLFDYSGVGEAMPEAYGADSPIRDPLVTVPKSIMYDLPKKAIEASQANPLPGLRREDYTDIPPDTTPDPSSPLGGIGVSVPRQGAQPVDPMVGASLEAATNVMGGTALSAPARAAGEMVAGAGPTGRLLPAVKYEGRVYRGEVGQNHPEILPPKVQQQMAAHGIEADELDRIPGLEIGFANHKGQFLDRSRAGEYAVDNGLVRDDVRGYHGDDYIRNGGLTTDMLRKGDITLGAGAADKRAAGVTALDDVDRVLEQERKLGASSEPRPAAPAAEPAPAATAPEVGPGGGGEAGAGGLEQAQATAARWAGDRKPLEGLQGPLKIGGEHFVPGPIGKVHDVAEDYMRTNRPEIEYKGADRFHPIDPEHSQAIAQAYDEMKHSPKDPATKASYDALIDETQKQYQAIKKSGLKIEPIPAGAPDPYATNPRLAARDVAENNHLWFFPTEGGFGTVNKITDNPMLRKTGEKIGDHEMLANDMFRVVHDYFGHLQHGHGFRAAGEDNAWRSHSAMYSDLARPAMTSETRGQNSWVNYGPHGEKNRTASGADTTYADQKVGLMPDWTMYDKGKEPIYAYHGSPHSFDRFDMNKIGAGEGHQAYGHGLYFAENPKVAKAYREQLSSRDKFEKNGQPTPWTHVMDDIVFAATKPGDKIGPAGAMADFITQGMAAGKSLKAIRRNYDVPAGAEEQWDKALKAAESYAYNKNPGHSYKVAIEANPEHFFDWDKPFGEQSPKVQEVMRPIIEDRMKIARDARKRIIAKGSPREVAKLQMEPFWADQPIEKLRGPKMYQMAGLPAVNQTEGHIKSSKRLLEAGVPGLKYYDQGSRFLANGAKTQNYVTFDDNMVRILRKYGVAGIPAAGVLGADGEERRAAGGRAVKRAMRRRAEGGGVGDDYNTHLGGADEMAYQAWKLIHAPQDSGADYDLRGAYASDMQRDPESGHMGDRFKKPNHPTFSDQSQYAVGDQRSRAGTWVGPEGPTQTFVPPTPYADGGAVSDEDQAAMMPETFVNPAVRHAIEGMASLPRRAIESSESMRRGDGYDPSPMVEAATLPMGTGAVAGVRAGAREMILGSGPVRRIADDTGSAMEVARKVRQQKYAEPEFTEGGSHIYNKGVENPPDPSIQTVADPHRMMYPGIYRNPRIIAEEAAARVGPEDPAMKQLFGVTRDDLREMAKGRVGNEDPNLRLAKNPSGSRSAQNIQTPQNTQRLQDILGEAGRHEGLRTADAWYIMDPVYQRMAQMFGPEEAVKRYKMLNTSTAMASPGSDVMTEIQRGTAAHWLQNEGRFGDFMKYAGVPEGLRSRTAGFPGDMRYIGGHPYHRTAQGGPMQKFFDTGSIQSEAPKVPLYAHASGVPETGFQTSGPVGDAHFSRGVGLSDTRKGPTDVQGSFSRGEYQTLQPWWQHEVAGPSGLESVPAQARLWTALGPQTGVESELGAPKLELLAKQIMVAARRLHISPEQARDLVLSGKAGAGMLGGAMAAPAVMDAMRSDQRASGGSVNAAMKVARDIRRAKGGAVHVGPIVGSTGGRADKVPMEVPDGSYVLTADHCSAMGEGNTLAGFEKLKKMFPKSVAAYKAAKERSPLKRASGGRVPIYAADGEFVICPEDIKDRYEDLDHGHKVLDHWQTSERKNHIETLSKLAPPAQD